MPELPEVETVRAGLATHVIGALVKEIKVHDSRSLKRNFSGPDGFIKELTGESLQGVIRRGKFLWLPVTATRAVVCHLGMSGQVLVRSKDFGEDKLTRITLRLEKPTEEEIEMSSCGIGSIRLKKFGGAHFLQLFLQLDAKLGIDRWDSIER